MHFGSAILTRAWWLAGQQAINVAPSVFRAALSVHFEILGSMCLLAAFSGKSDDNKLQQAQECLRGAQQACDALPQADIATHRLKALVAYAAAVYAVTVNDMPAAASCLDAAAMSLSHEAGA